jgi:hypothetical protein
LAHNEWNPEKKRSEVKVLYNFGREEEVDRDALERLLQSVAKYLGPEEFIKHCNRDKQNVKCLSSRPMGGAYLLDMLWRRLNIKQEIEALLSARNFTMPVERAIFAMVANRVLAPGSKLATEDWVKEDVHIDGLSEVPVQNLYRSMDFLLEAQEELQKNIFFEVSNLQNLEVDLLYFDTTSTYFEIEDADDAGSDKQNIRQYGNSKDHRPDRPQAVIGLAVTRDGIPVRCWSWPGNTADMSVVEQVKKDLMG